MIRLAMKLVGLVVTGILIYLAVTATQVWLASRQNDARNAQAIVVMGSAEYNGRPSPDLQSRLDHALDLWHKGLAPIIVVTGGSRPGDRFTESEVSASYLTRRGVPKTGAVWSVDGNTTWQSLSAAASLLKHQGVSTVLLVSDPFHSARIDAIASQLGLTPYPSPTRTSPITGLSTVPYFAKETVGVAVGRIIGYNHLADLHG